MSRFSRSIVNSTWLREQIGVNKKVRIFDCTTVLDTAARKPYAVVSGRAGYEKQHIKGAEFFDIEHFSKGPEEVDRDTYGNPLTFMMLEPSEFLSRLGKSKGIDNDTHLILYHQATSKPVWATRVWWMLYASGYAGQYSVLDGGLAKWAAEGGETAEGPDTTTFKPTILTPQEDLIKKNAFVGKEAVQEALAKGEGHPVIHALPKPSFDGANSMWGKAGHISGAINVSPFAMLNADDHDTFVSNEEVQKLFAASGVTEQPASLTTYCGAGISATIPVFLALTQLGWDCPIQMYDGSLSEWCADESCPMVTPKP